MSATPQDKRNALEYAILQLAEWSIEENKWLDFADFESKNDFSKDKILLLPFFLSTANGTRTEMFKFYDKFVAAQIGYVEKEIEEEIDNFQFIELIEQDSKIKFTDTFRTTFGINTNQIETDLLEKKLPISYNEIHSNIEYENTFQLIKHSVEAFRDKGWKIINFDAEALGRLSRKHSTWSVYRMINRLQDNVIDTRFLIKEKSMFASDENNRILI